LPDDANEIVLWQVDGDGSAAFVRGLGEALSGERSRHVLTKDELLERLDSKAATSADVLACFKGVAPCLSPKSVAIDAVGVSTIVRVNLDDVGATFALVDRRGQTIRDETVSGGSPRDLAFKVVRGIFDATGTVAFETDPPGAVVYIGGSPIGNTPLSHRLPVGTYDYTLRFPDHADVADQVTVGSGETPIVRHDLDLLVGMLMVSDAPPGAEVYLNDRLIGSAGNPMEVEPGTYSLEVRADGYEPVRDAVTITPGSTVTRAAPMDSLNLFTQPISDEQILANNYIFRVGYEADFQSTTLLDARTDDDLPLEFLGFTENGAVPSDAILRRTLASNALRLDLSYAFRNFGVVLASISYGVGNANQEGVLVARDGTTANAQITDFARLHLRPFQIFWRAIYGNWVPSVEIGSGFVFNWFDAERFDTGETETLRRTDAMWTFGIAAQYYVTPNFFGNVRYSLQGYFNDAVGADHMLSLSVGVAFANVFGFEPEPPATLSETEEAE
jgi:hypothetical protein